MNSLHYVSCTSAAASCSSGARNQSVLAPSPCPPSYAAAVPIPLYSQNPHSCEYLLEASIPPPAYNIRRTTTVSSIASSSSGTSAGSSTSLAVRPSTAPSPSSDTRPEFVFSSGGIQISLGKHEPGMDIPSYGRGGTIRGTLKLKKPSHVQEVIVIVRFTFLLPSNESRS